MVVSQNREPQYRPQHTISLMTGTSKRVPLILGNPRVTVMTTLLVNLGLPPLLSYLWVAGNEGMDKTMETTMMGYIKTTIRIHSFIPSCPMGKFFRHELEHVPLAG